MDDKELIKQVKKIASEYPENSINKAILLQIADRFIGQQIQLEERECLHCGKNVAGYCEECYQELIGENAKLQYENTELKKNKEHMQTTNVNFETGIDKGSGEDQTAFVRFIPENIIKFKLAEAEAKLKSYKAARQNDKPITTYIQIVKLTSEIEIYKELLGENNENHILHID